MASSGPAHLAVSALMSKQNHESLTLPDRFTPLQVQYRGKQFIPREADKLPATGASIQEHLTL